MDSILTIILAVVGSGALSALIVAFANRRKTESEAALTAVSAANAAVKNLVEPLNNRIDRLEQENHDLRLELENQARSLEDLTACNLKYQLAVQVFMFQMREAGIKPLIEDIEKMTAIELRAIVRELGG